MTDASSHGSVSRSPGRLLRGPWLGEALCPFAPAALIAVAAVSPAGLAGPCPVVPFPGLTHPIRDVRGVSAGDLDGDGDIDLAACVRNGVVALLNRGDGTYESVPSSHSYLNNDSPGTLGDVDLDGDLDVVIGRSVSQEEGPYVMFNDGTGRFEIDAAGGGFGLQDLRLVDLNGDGVLDLLSVDHTAFVEFGNGDGTFAARTQLAPEIVGGLGVGDLDADGDPDLVIAHGSVPVYGSVSVLLNDGAGVFAEHARYDAGWSPDSVALGDMDGDGATDIVVLNRGSDDLGVYLNQGGGAFALAARHETGLDPGHMLLGDLDGDRRPDAVVATRAGVTAQFNDGGGAFDAARLIVPVVDVWEQAVLSDTDGDGDLDLVLFLEGTDDHVTVYTNDGAGAFATHDRYVGSGGGQRAVIGDVNGDGLDDVVGPNTSNELIVRLGIGEGRLGEPTGFPVSGWPYPAFLDDVDGDGDLDAVVPSGSDGVGTLLNNGDGTFGPEHLDSSVFIGDLCAYGDMDGDGRKDIVTASQTVFVYRALGNGSYERLGDPYQTDLPWDDLTLIDLDRDGDLDAVAVERYYKRMIRFENDGTGVFERIGAFLWGQVTGVPLAFDADGDGVDDLALPTIEGFRMFFGRDGGWRQGNVFAHDSGRAEGLLFDVDGDGDEDFVYLRYAPTIVAFNDGQGGFVESAELADGAYQSGRVADLNLDGVEDLVLVGSREVAVLRSGAGGVLRPAEIYDLDVVIRDVRLADLSGDGVPDIVCSAQSVDGVIALVNARNGIFVLTSAHEFPGTPWAFACADFDGDGDVDLAGAFGRALRVFMNDGSGDLSLVFERFAADDIGFVEAADLDGDGDFDLVSGSPDADWNVESVTRYLNDGTGAFQSDRLLTGNFEDLAVADLNGDSLPDIVRLRGGSLGGSLYVSLSDDELGYAQFGIETQGLAQSLVVGDVDGDGDRDLLASSVSNDTTVIHFNDGTGAFPVEHFGEYADDAAFLDADQDGDTDVVYTRGGFAESPLVGVAMNDGGGRYPDLLHFETIDRTTAIAAGDLDADGATDIVATLSSASADIAVLLNQSDDPPGCAPADLAAPFGVLDLDDILAFVTAFMADDPIADLAPPFGTLDLADLVGFIASFEAGCP